MRSGQSDEYEKRKVRVLVVDDHAVVRSGICMVLDGDDEIDVVGEASSGEESIELVHQLDPDVVVMDCAMPGLSGFEATQRIRQSRPRTQVVALTMHDSEAYLFEMLRAGAVGYVLKRASSADVIHAVKAAANQETVLDPGIAKLLVRDFFRRAERGEDVVAFDPLSAREREVLKLVSEGRTNREIAELLFVSVKTVQAHRANLMRKLGMHDRTELVKYALRRGLVALDES